MKKATALLLFLVILLSFSCGKPAEPVPETTSEPTTEPITNPTPSLRASIIGEGVSYRVIECDDAMLLAMGNWNYSWDGDLNKQRSLYLSDEKQVLLKEHEGYRSSTFTITLHDYTTGKETVLMEHWASGHFPDGAWPYLSCAMDERYFLISWLGWGTFSKVNSVYDIKQMKETEIDFPSDFEPYFLNYIDGWLYFVSVGEKLLNGEFHLMCVKLSDIKSGELKAVDVPEDITISGAYSKFISGRYFFTNAEDENYTPCKNYALVFDIEQRKCVLKLEGHDYFSYPIHGGRDKLLFKSHLNNTHYLIEITLP